MTVTGAPKLWAMQFIEDHEQSVRAWYGGAVGKLGFDGSLNTGLTLRTIRLKDGVAQVRAGATLLYDSDPDAEERETRLKASALLEAIERDPTQRPRAAGPGRAARRARASASCSSTTRTRSCTRWRTTSAAPAPRSSRLRYGFDPEEFDALAPHLVVLSPGPGSPQRLRHVAAPFAQALARKLPIFGVCLGLQALVEHFGGELGVLELPDARQALRGRACSAARLFEGIAAPFIAGRYHSLHARARAR